MSERIVFVSFHMIEGECIAAVSLGYVQEGRITEDTELRSLAEIYVNSISTLKNMVEEIEEFKSNKIALSPSHMWDIGDTIVSLVEGIDARGFQIDNLYDHLVRDIGRNRDWLNRVMIFRRHLPKRELIPSGLKWSACKRAPKRSAEMIERGVIPGRRSERQ